jgi:hypothetical protein
MYNLIQRLKKSILCRQREMFVIVASVSEQTATGLRDGSLVSADAESLRDTAVVVGNSIKETRLFHI